MGYGISAQLNLASIQKSRKDFEKHLIDLQRLANNNIIQMNVSNTNQQLNQTSRAINGASQQARGFSTNMTSAISRVARYAVGMGAVYGAIRLVKNGIQEVIDLNKSNIAISMITGKSIEDVESMNKGWLEMANRLKVVNSEVAKGAEEWLRSGVSMDEANANLETTTKLAKIAGESNEDMSSSLITIKNAYGLNSEALEEYASRVALLDNQSATSSAKINKAMQYSAETFKSTGVDMDTALSMITNFSEKSAMSGEAIGRGFKSMLLNYHKMRAGFKSGDGEEVEMVNKLEGILASKGLALRKNKDEWIDLGTVIKSIQQNMGKFTEVQKSELAFMIGGKQQAEMTLSTLNNMERISELNTKIKADDGAKALTSSYDKYLGSIEAKQAQLKNKLTGMWTNIIDSNQIKGALDILIKLVDVVGFLATDGAKLTAIWIGLVIAIKNFKLLEMGIMGCVTAFKYLSTFGVESLTLLSFNPIVLALTAMVGIIGAVTYAQYKHSKQVKELKEEYATLNKAMNELDPNGAEVVTHKLREQQKELQRLKLIADEEENNGSGVKTGHQATENLNAYIKTLEEAGFHVNEFKWQINELQTAEKNSIIDDKIKSIKDKTEATISESNETQALIGQYQNLASQENLSAEKKKMLSNLTYELVDKVDGLTIATDANGNASITNSNLLTKQIDVIDLLKQTAVTSANAQISKERELSQVLVDGTAISIGEMRKRVKAYGAMIQMYTVDADSANGGDGTYVNSKVQQAIVKADKYSQILAGIDSQIGKIASIPVSRGSTSSGGGKGFTPTKETSKGKSEKTATAVDKFKTEFDVLEREIKRREDLVDDAKDKIENLKLKDPDNIKEEIRLTNELIKQEKFVKSTYENQVKKYSQQLSHLKKGSEEYNFLSDQVEKYREKIDDSTKSLLTHEKTLKDIEKEKAEKLKEQTEKLQEIYDLQNKIANIQKEKNVRIYKDGRWQFQANETEIASAQKEIKEKKDAFAETYGLSELGKFFKLGFAKIAESSFSILNNIPTLRQPNFAGITTNNNNTTNSGTNYNFNNVTIECSDVSDFVNQMSTFNTVN